MIGDVLLECELGRRRGRWRASRTTRGGRCLDEGAEPLGRVVAGFGNDGESGLEGCRDGRVSARTSTARLCRGNRGSPTACSQTRWRTPTGWASRRSSHRRRDELERQAHEVSAGRARARGGRR